MSKRNEVIDYLWKNYSNRSRIRFQRFQTSQNGVERNHFRTDSDEWRYACWLHAADRPLLRSMDTATVLRHLCRSDCHQQRLLLLLFCLNNIGQSSDDCRSYLRFKVVSNGDRTAKGNPHDDHFRSVGAQFRRIRDI